MIIQHICVWTGHICNLSWTGTQLAQKNVEHFETCFRQQFAVQCGIISIKIGERIVGDFQPQFLDVGTITQEFQIRVK